MVPCRQQAVKAGLLSKFRLKCLSMHVSSRSRGFPRLAPENLEKMEFAFFGSFRSGPLNLAGLSRTLSIHFLIPPATSDISSFYQKD